MRRHRPKESRGLWLSLGRQRPLSSPCRVPIGFGGLRSDERAGGIVIGRWVKIIRTPSQSSNPTWYEDGEPGTREQWRQRCYAMENEVHRLKCEPKRKAARALVEADQYAIETYRVFKLIPR